MIIAGQMNILEGNMSTEHLKLSGEELDDVVKKIDQAIENRRHFGRRDLEEINFHYLSCLYLYTTIAALMLFHLLGRCAEIFDSFC